MPILSLNVVFLGLFFLALLGVGCLVWLPLLTVRPVPRTPTQYVTRHGLRITWTKEEFFVDIESVETETTRALELLRERYPNASVALRNCKVIFREPVWIQWITGRRVTGEQDNTTLMVGWYSDIRLSSFAHELAHRVVQVFSEDPSEKEAHDILNEIGL